LFEIEIRSWIFGWVNERMKENNDKHKQYQAVRGRQGKGRKEKGRGKGNKRWGKRKK